MTLNVSHNGQFKVLTALELVEDAFRDIGLEPKDLGEGFIAYWIREGKSLQQIINIACNRPDGGNGE